MKLGLIMSAWFGTELDGKAGLARTRAIGFDTADLFWDPTDHTEAERRQLLRDVEDVGLPVPSLVCPSFGLNDFNPSVRSFHVERACRHVDLAADVGAGNVLFVPGEYLFQQRLLPASYEWGLAVAATQAIGAYAGERGVELAVEMLPFDFALVRDVDTMVEFLDAVGLDNVRACIDCSHLWLVRDDPDSLARLRDRIAHVHISDCDGEHHGDLPPGRGNTPLVEILQQVQAAGYDGTVAVELEFAPDPAEMIAWVEESFATTTDIMRRAGVLGDVRHPADAGG